LWNVADGKPLAVLRGTSELVERVAYSPDGRRIAAGGADGSIRIWDVGANPGTVEMDARAGQYAVRDPCFQFSRDGSLLASGLAGQACTLWDATTGRALVRYVLNTQKDVVSGLAITPDRRELRAITLNGQVLSWDLRRGGSPRSLTERGDQNVSPQLSNDGQLAACTRSNESIQLFYPDGETAKPREPVKLSQPRWQVFLAFSPDGRWLAAGCSDGRVLIYDTSAPGLPPRAISVSPDMNVVQISPDGRLLGSYQIDEHRIRFWQLADLKPFSTLTPEENYLLKWTFSADGHQVLRQCCR
jgi:WD40 repeat protein